MMGVTCVLFTVANVRPAAGTTYTVWYDGEMHLYSEQGLSLIWFITIVLMFEPCLVRAHLVLNISAEI